MKSLLSAGNFSPIAVLKIYLPKGQVVRAFSVVQPKIYLSRTIGRVGISSRGKERKMLQLLFLYLVTALTVFLTGTLYQNVEMCFISEVRLKSLRSRNLKIKMNRIVFLTKLPGIHDSICQNKTERLA